MNIELQMDTNNFCLYARVSSREQEREGYSINAQLKSCRDYAVAHDLRIVKEFIDIESAKNFGRKQFTELINYLCNNNNTGIICEKVDRLYRNLKDYLTIDDLKRDLVFVKENTIYTSEAKASEKLMHGIKVLMARNYLDNLSDEVKKGLYEKFSQGGYPRQAPLGYFNDKNTRTVKINQNTAPHVVKLFDLYATGNYSLDKIASILYKDGLRGKTGKRIFKAALHKSIQEPFYYGLMRYNGMTGIGNHKPIIDKKIWDQANEMLKNRTKSKKIKHDFALKGNLKCYTCGSYITAEIQRGHVYYRCTHSKPCSEKKYVREEVLSNEIEHILADLEMDEEFVQLMIKATKEANQEELQYNLHSVENLNKQLERVKKKLSRLVDSHLDNKIPDDLYEIKKDELLKEKAQTEIMLSNHSQAHEVTFEQLEKVLKVAQQARRLFKVGDIKTKQTLLSLISSNILIHDGQIASYQLNPVFSYLMKGAKTPENINLSGREDSNLRPLRPKRSALAN